MIVLPFGTRQDSISLQHHERTVSRQAIEATLSLMVE